MLRLLRLVQLDHLLELIVFLVQVSNHVIDVGDLRLVLWAHLNCLTA